MADQVKRPNKKARILNGNIEMLSYQDHAAQALAGVAAARKAFPTWRKAFNVSDDKLARYLKEFGAAYKDIAGTQAQDDRLCKTWIGYADKIIKLQARKDDKKAEREIKRLHDKAEAVWDQVHDQFDKLEKKYDKLDLKYKALRNLPV